MFREHSAEVLPSERASYNKRECALVTRSGSLGVAFLLGAYEVWVRSPPVTDAVDVHLLKAETNGSILGELGAETRTHLSQGTLRVLYHAGNFNGRVLVDVLEMHEQGGDLQHCR